MREGYKQAALAVRFGTVTKTISLMLIFLIAMFLYSRILVLENGKVVEFDKPQVLLTNRQGIFFSMASDAHLI